MAAIYTPATPWQGAELNITNRRTTRVAVGIITGITTTGVPDALLLENAYGATGMPLLGSSYPDNPQWICQGIRIVPWTAFSCRVYHTYGSVDWGQSLYLIRDSTTVESIQTEVLPGPSKLPFRIRYNSSANAAENLHDTVKLTISVPIRSIDVTMISFGAPPTGFRPYVGWVNDGTFLGLGAGFWLLTRFESDISRFASSYQATASIMTRNTEDWSVYGTLQNAQTGRYIDGTEGFAHAEGLPYHYGIIYPPGSGSGSGATAFSGSGSSANSYATGVIRVGPYQTTNFTTLFPGLNAADGGGPALPFGGGGPFPTGS